MPYVSVKAMGTGEDGGDPRPAAFQIIDHMGPGLAVRQDEQVPCPDLERCTDGVGHFGTARRSFQPRDKIRAVRSCSFPKTLRGCLELPQRDPILVRQLAENFREPVPHGLPDAAIPRPDRTDCGPRAINEDMQRKRASLLADRGHG